MTIVAGILSIVLLVISVLNFFGYFDSYADEYWKIQAFGWNVVAVLLWFK